MIKEAYEHKVCDLCKKTVAVREFLRFKTIEPYYKLDRNSYDILGRNTIYEADFCNDCWTRMKRRVQTEMEEEERLRKLRKLTED